jgi:hypothetical protein
VESFKPGGNAYWGALGEELIFRVLRGTRITRNQEDDATMSSSRDQEKQNVTLSLTRRVIRKARILAARRETSISGLLSQEIESLVASEEAYERSERQAVALLEQGFHLGGKIAGRDKLHER